MLLSAIAAMDLAGGMGFEGRIPWYLPSDVRHFRVMTMGRAIIMGRRTCESLGRALEGRLNIVVTRTKGFSAPGFLVALSPAHAVAEAEAAGHAEAVVVGGAELYEVMLPLCDAAVITLVGSVFDADTRFPVALLARELWDASRVQQLVPCVPEPYWACHLYFERLRGLTGARADITEGRVGRANSTAIEAPFIDKLSEG